VCLTFISEVMFFAIDCVNFLALYILDAKETFIFSHVFVFFLKFSVKNTHFLLSMFSYFMFVFCHDL